jgi:hypothetical protein
MTELRLLLLLALNISCLIFTGNIQGQDVLPASQKSSIEHNDQQRQTLMVNIEPEPKTLKKAWIRFLKRNYKFKLKGMGLFSNKDLLCAEEVNIPRISDKTMNFYTHVVESETGSKMNVFAQYGYDIYITDDKYPAAFDSINNMIVMFLNQYLPDYYRNKIANSEKMIKRLSKDIEKLKDDISDNKKDIKKMRQEIEEKEEEIKKGEKKLDLATEKLEISKRKLDKVKSKINK